jgi:hypothetical protein
MATLEGREPISNIKGIATADNSLYLLSDRIASLNFDGFIPRDNTLVYASDLTPGQTVFTSDPTARDNSLFITRIDTKTVTVESVEETSYLLYYLGDNDLESPYTYGATNVDGSFSQNHLFNVYVDDISDVALGTTGWMMTNQGNAVFSNVFVRGTIEATSGQIDGILKVGESSEGDPLVTIGKNIFSSTPFEGSSGEHSGLFLNKNNYLLGYNVPTNIPITSIVVSDSTGTDYLRKATFTLVGHTLALNDLVSISGFDDDKFIELDNVFPVKEITTDTFTVYYKNPISGTTNPISANLKAESFALNNIYDITSFSLSETTSSTTTSSVNVYLDTNFITLFLQGQVTNLNSIVNSSLLAANGVHKIVSVTNLTDQDNSYFTITTRRIAAGTYTTDLGQITLFNSNYKFKVGDSDNSMSYNSFTGALTVTGRINANSGNFTNTVSIGEPNIFYSVSNKQLLNNEAILTTSTPHSFVVGDSVTIIGVDSTFNGTYSVTSVPTEETFIYSKTATNVSSTAVSPVGTVSRGAPVDGTLLVGYGSNQIIINGTGLDSTSAIFAGAGNYGNADTGFFMDASGRFSLKDKLTFTGGNLTVSGTINASAGNFTGYVTAGNMKIGKDVESTNDGVYINSTNYWYDDGKFSLGSGTKKIYFDGTDVKITSDVIIEGGLTATSLTVGTSPNQVIISPTAVSGNPGISITGSGDFIRNTGAFRLGGANGISYSGSGTVTVGSDVNVNGNISGASGTFGGSIKIGSGESVFIADSNGIYLGNETFSSAEFRVTPAGALTATGATITGVITATSGSIEGDFEVNGDAQINGSLFVGANPSSGQRVSINDLGIVGIDNSGITIFNLPATSASAPTITNFNVIEAKITGQGENAYLIAGTTGASATNVVVRGDKSGGQAAAIYSTISGTATSATTGNGFYLDDTGKFRFAQGSNVIAGSAGNLSVTGTINATAGYIGGTTSGWLINSDLLSNSSVGFYAPSVRTGTVTGNGSVNVEGSTTLITASTTIVPKVGMAIINNNLLSGGTYITAVTGTSPTYTITLSSPFLTGNANQPFTISEYAIYAGNATRQLSPFKIDYFGNLTASNANISGKITATSGSFTGTVNALNGLLGGEGGWKINEQYLLGGSFENVGIASGLTYGVRKNLIQNPSLEKSSAGYVSVGSGTTISRVSTDAYSGSYSLEITRAAASGSGISLYQNSGSRYPLDPPVVVSSSVLFWNQNYKQLELVNSSGIEIGMSVTGTYIPSNTWVTGVWGNRVTLSEEPTFNFSNQNITFTKVYSLAMFVKIPSGGETTTLIPTIDYYDASGSLVSSSSAGTQTVSIADGWKNMYISFQAASFANSFVFKLVTGSTGTAGKKILVDGFSLEQYDSFGFNSYFDGDSVSETYAPARWLGEPGLSASQMPKIAFWAGASLGTYNSAPFIVGYDGYLAASNVNITGNITATSGTIGGFNIPFSDPYRLESTITQLDTGIRKITLDSTLDSIGVLDRLNVVETSYQTRPSSFDGSYGISSAGLGYTLSGSVTISSVAISGTAPNKTIVYTVNPNPEQIFAGDSVTISGLSGTVAPLNTMDVAVSSTTTTTITVTGYNTSIANGTYGLQSGTIGPLGTPYLIADSTFYTDTGSIENYIFTAITSDVGFEYGSAGGPNIILGKTRLGDVGLSAVSAIDGSPDVMYIQPGGGITEFGGPIGTSLFVNRLNGTSADLTAGVIANNTGWLWAHRNGSATDSSLYLTRNHVAGAWRGLQFLRSLTAGAAMSVTGYISVALSTTTAPTFAAGSDYRLKTNIETASDDFINKISSLRLVRFDEIAVPENTNQLGFIAHEVQEIIPEAIEGEKDAVDENGDPDYQHIMQVKMLPYLVGALQESIKKIEDLENRLAALES